MHDDIILPLDTSKLGISANGGKIISKIFSILNLQLK